MDAVNTKAVTANECRDLAHKATEMAERAGSKLQLERAAYLARAAKVLSKAAEADAKD